MNILKIREKNVEAADSIQVRTFAYRQIANGLGRILKHTVKSPLDDGPTNRAFFDAIKSPSYLTKLSQKSVYFPFWIGKGDSKVRPRPDYECWVEDIRAGEALIADAIYKYQSYLGGKTLSLVSAVLQDDFYQTDYRFNRRDHEQSLFQY